MSRARSRLGGSRALQPSRVDERVDVVAKVEGDRVGATDDTSGTSGVGDPSGSGGTSAASDQGAVEPRASEQRANGSGSGAPGGSAGRRTAQGRASVRATRQGDAVSSALAATNAFTSAQDLHARLRLSGQSVGLTTVYRHLQVLAERGEVDVLRRDDGETVYRRCTTEAHHHHLVCRHCGHTVEIAGPEIEAWTSSVASAEGFTEVVHTVEIYGTCAECTAAGPTETL
nr:Fur family transcriptional regulator [Frankia sp. CcI49]